ncbi:MAG: hypothetical protein GXP45_01595 [bacterium]|nr:hypothetical protein [bacterium]
MPFVLFPFLLPGEGIILLISDSNRPPALAFFFLLLALLTIHALFQMFVLFAIGVLLGFAGGFLLIHKTG